MAQINKPSDYFDTNLVTGTTADQNITGMDFQPDWVWSKQRDAVGGHRLVDSVRGTGKSIFSNGTDAEATENNISSFNSDGYTLVGAGVMNENTKTYAQWCWLAGGSASSNTDGSITSTVSANTTSGFSIVKWSGSGANATIGHSLNSTPKMVITKSLGSSAWGVYNENLGNTKVLFLDTTAGESANVAYWNNTSPTSTVFSVGTDSAVNHSGNDMIAYCFAEKKGFSKFGSYTGNGSTDGTFVYTGFKPAWVMTKRTTDGSESWHIFDNKRNTFNAVDKRLQANSSGNEDTAAPLGDFVSNGFKIRGTGGGINVSGKNFIYMAFAENPLVGTNNIPATAR